MSGEGGPGGVPWRNDEARYERGVVLGRGGMGEVRVARDTRLEREVALKTMRHDGVSEGARGRFLREARIQGQLEHPSIVPVYDLACSELGELHFTMRRVRGRTLRSILGALRAGDREAEVGYASHKLLGAFANICLAVAFAHSRGIVHRDIKPSNLMLGDYGEVYVLDWGVAKVLGIEEDAETSETRLAHSPRPGGETEPGTTLGTLGYMAPEQLVASDAIDARADIYSLGAVLFEILTLEKLHRKQHDVFALAGAEVRARLLACPRDVPPELAEACIAATAMRRDDRTQSARELHEVLERYLRHERDVDLRRRMAAEHATAAAAAARQALARDEAGARERALQQTGRALALDPENRTALAAMTELLVTPPKKPPPEVLAGWGEVRAARARAEFRVWLKCYLFLLLFVPLILWMGVRVWWMFGAWLASVALVCGGAFFSGRARRPHEVSALLGIALNAVLISTTALAMGPFVVTPAFAAVIIQVSVAAWDRGRVMITGIAAAALLATFALEWVGWLPPAYGFSEAGMQLHARMLHLPALPTQVMLALTVVGATFVAAALGAFVRDEADLAERTLLMQSWQLQKMAALPSDGGMKAD